MAPIALTTREIALLVEAAALDWGSIDTAIIGTLAFNFSVTIPLLVKRSLGGDDTTFTLTADQTAASLSGTGGLSFGAPATITIIHNDDDCDISADKTYTHAIDFGTNSGLAVGDINGVPFLSTSATSGTCTGTDGRTYGFKGMPSLGHAGNDRTAASGKLHKLQETPLLLQAVDAEPQDLSGDAAEPAEPDHNEIQDRRHIGGVAPVNLGHAAATDRSQPAALPSGQQDQHGHQDQPSACFGTHII